MRRKIKNRNYEKILRKSIRKVQARKRAATDAAIVRVSAPPERPWELDNEAITILKNSVAKGASDEELKYCLTVARRYRLDPFKQQIWFVKRWDSSADNGKGGKGAYVWTPQVGINGLLFAAARDHKNEFGSVSLPEYGPMETQEWSNDGKTFKFPAPVFARVKVWKKGETEPTEAQAWWDEYAPADLSKAPFWRKMPRRMIGKCAIALAIRQAYPDLGGIYIPEECERFAEDYTPEGRQIVQEGSHEAAQRVLREKLASRNPNPLEPETAPLERPASQEPVSSAVPKAQIPPREWRGTVEIDWSVDSAFPRITGDIAEVAAHFPVDLVLKRVEDFWRAFREDVPRIKAACEKEGFRVNEIHPKSSAPQRPVERETTAKRGSGSIGSGTSGTVAPVVVSGIIERVNSGMAGKYPVKQVTLLLADKTKPTYSCFDKALFEELDKGLGKQSALVVKQNGKYFNIIALRKIGSREWLEDGTPVIQKNREAGGRTLFP